MGSPKSGTTENPGPRRQGGGAYYSDERPSRGPWPGEVPPTGVLTGVLGEMAFYYGACWLHHRCSAQQRRGKTR